MPLVHRLVTFIASSMIAVNLELIHDLWVPNIFIYNLKTFQVIDVLSKLAGLWINNKKEVYYRFVLLLDIHVQLFIACRMGSRSPFSQATHITFICPMLFDSFPLDTQVCKFQVREKLRVVLGKFRIPFSSLRHDMSCELPTT